MPAPPLRTRSAAILARLLLVLGVLLADLIPDPRSAQATVAPVGAADLLRAQAPAILPADAARLIATLPQDDTADAAPSGISALTAPQGSGASVPAPTAPACHHAAHLRPFPHGPPAV